MSAACPQCSLPLPEPPPGQTTIRCSGCGHTVFHAAGIAGDGIAGNVGAGDDDDWLTLDDRPVRETQTAPTVNRAADDGPEDVLTLDDASGGSVLDDDDELSLAPAKPRGAASPAADLGDLFDDLDLPDQPPPAGARPSSAGARPSLAGGSQTPETAMELTRPAAVAGGDLLSASNEADYRVKCPICDSVMFVTAAMTGRKIQCSDCQTDIRVPPPPATPPKTKPATGPVPGGAAAANSPSRPVTDLGDGIRLRGGPSGERPADPFTKSAGELLDQASREEIEQEDTNYDVPDVKEWAIGVVSVFKDISVVAHWAILSALGGLAAAVAAMFTEPKFAFLILPFAALFGLFTLACGFAILEATANNSKSVDNWPTVDFGQLFENALVTGAAALVAGLPIFLVSTFIFGAGLVTTALTMLSIYALFPFVLLSMLDAGSVTVPFSSEVARSFNQCQESWGGLYLSAAAVMGAFFLWLMAATLSESPGIWAVTVSLFVFVVFVYFAMIGRLAYAIGQSVRRDNDGIATGDEGDLQKS